MITKDQVLDQTLEEILAGDKDSEEDYNIVKELVTTALFSRIKQRRKYCKRVLEKYLKTPISIETITEDGIIYAYINFSNIPRYVLVGRYRENDPTFETMPTKNEMEKWKQGQGS